ncbi:MAG: ATP-binding protein [Bacteroidota bacterium]
MGRRDLEKKNIDVMSLIKTTLDLLTIPESVAIIIEDDLPEVWFNPTQLQQVFQNLIGNSIKFMNKSDGEVRISCSQREGEAKFSIEDNGPGISQDHSEKIFKIFQTLHARDDIESTGIGLTIVKKIIELNSGKIWLDTSYTEGTRLYFTIPVSRKEPINAPRYA